MTPTLVSMPMIPEGQEKSKKYLATFTITITNQQTLQIIRPKTSKLASFTMARSGSTGSTSKRHICSLSKDASLENRVTEKWKWQVRSISVIPVTSSVVSTSLHFKTATISLSSSAVYDNEIRISPLLRNGKS